MLLCAAGQGAGETSLAVPFADAARAAGYRVFAVTDRARNADLLAGHVDDCRVVDWTKPWWGGVATGAADAIVASSSFTCASHLPLLARHLYPAPLVCIDSSWLPWYREELHGVVDAFVLPYPQPAFEAGLLGRGGDFALDPGVRERMHAPGWFFPREPLPPEYAAG